MELLSAGDPRLAASSELTEAVAQVQAAQLPEALEPARARVLEFVAEHPNALHRSCLSGHLTGSAVVIDPQRGQTLLMLHRKLGRWFQPGGHADGDSNLAAVALREATEETGIAGLTVAVPAIELDVHMVPTPPQPHLHLDLRFLVIAPAGAVESPNHESVALRWVALDGLGELGVDPGTVRLVERGLALASLL